MSFLISSPLWSFVSRNDVSHCLLGPAAQDGGAEGGGAGQRGRCVRVPERHPLQYRLERPGDPRWLRQDPWTWWGHFVPGRLPGRLPHRPVSHSTFIHTKLKVYYSVRSVRDFRGTSRKPLTLDTLNQFRHWMSIISRQMMDHYANMLPQLIRNPETLGPVQSFMAWVSPTFTWRNRRVEYQHHQRAACVGLKWPRWMRLRVAVCAYLRASDCHHVFLQSHINNSFHIPSSVLFRLAYFNALLAFWCRQQELTLWWLVDRLLLQGFLYHFNIAFGWLLLKDIQIYAGNK